MKGKVMTWTVRLMLLGFILTALLIYGITLAQEKGPKPLLGPPPQKVEGATGPHGETAPDG